MSKILKTPRFKGSGRSRSGCTNCKRRKKKCDEIKPICTGCYRRNLECKYLELERFESADKEDLTALISGVSSKELLGDDCSLLIGSWLDSDLSYMFPLHLETDIDEAVSQMELQVELQVDTLIRFPRDITRRDYKYLKYWVDEILPELSMLPSPTVANYYSNIYLRMALTEPAVLYCLICWGCRAKRGHSLDYQIRSEEYEALMSVIRDELTKMQADLTKKNFFSCFVCYMALVTMEISFGDTRMWSRYFNACFHMANKMPGCLKYLTNECYTEGWVLSQNFAYFDILASQTNENGTFYSISDYIDILSANNNDIAQLQSDPMQGCIRPMILLIGKIVSLLVEYNALKVSSDYLNPNCDRYSIVAEMLEKANNLDNEICFCKPDFTFLNNLTKEELEYHLTLFEAMQISTQLYLRQVIKNLPAVVPEVELLSMNLKEDMHVLIESQRFRKSLAFPMLQLGLCVSSAQDRKEVKEFFERLIKMCGYLSSYQSIWILIQKVWDLNSNGQVYVDWFKISKQMEWKLNLAR